MPIPLHTTYLPRTYRILAVKRETAMVQTFTLDCSLGAKPGQFLMVWLPGVDEIPMSVAFDDGKTTRLTFFAVGDMTKELAKLGKGDLLGLRGPFGTHYTWKPKQRLILVAGGYGAAPMYFVAKEALKDKCRIDMIIGARSKEHLLYIKEFKAVKGVTLHISTDDGSMGFKGYNVQVLEKLITDSKILHSPFSIHQVFACGPERMLKRISEITAKAKIPSQLSLERYMKCGYGLCGNCVVDPLGIRLCVEGPVIDNKTCVKIAEFGKYHRDALGKRHPF
jgi:dihydroorotate dehydrogenase electron transfer subunit